MKQIEEKLQNLPNKPGIYLFYSGDELIYVGKASSLKKRVKSYFQKQDKKDKTAREVIRPIEEMIEQVDELEFKETDSALEAIILEAEYIKKHQPKYNVLGKDNKSWNYIAITSHEYPSVTTVRQHQYKNMDPEEREQKFEEVFGPYPKLNTKATLKILRKLFNYSTCQTKDRPEGKPCLYYQMGKCLGVCTDEISPSEYRKKVIKPLKKFLSGDKDELIDQLQEKMEQASDNKEYEEAARIRDQIESLNHIHDVALLNESFVEDAFSINKLDISRIEGYDISNLGKTGVVGSLVVFKDGEPQKDQYRKFKIKEVEGQSDVDSLKEVISRRAKYFDTEESDFAKEDPDLIVVDGGKPQVNALREVLEQKQVQEIPVMGIAKGEDRDKNELIIQGLKPELIKWIKENKKTLVKVRDEAHRFALKYQQKIREKRFD